MGGYEPNPVPWAVDGIPRPFQFQLLEPDFDHFAPIMELAVGRVPALATAGINQLINGPESFTPDGNFILGEAPELKNFFVGAGLQRVRHRRRRRCRAWRWPNGCTTASRRTTCGSSTSVASVGRTRTPTGCARARSRRTASTTRWPGRSKSTTAVVRVVCRRCTRVCSSRARRSARSWAGNGRTGSPTRRWARAPHDQYTYERQNWFAAVGREHRACREAAVLVDQTSFAKFALKGPDASRCARLDLRQRRRQAGRLVDLHADARRRRWHPMRPDGVSRGAPTSSTSSPAPVSRRTTSTGSRRNIPAGANAQLFDITSAWSVLTLMGPNARTILQSVTRADLEQRRVPVRDDADDRHRRVPGARVAGDVHGRARVGAASAGRVRDAGVRRVDGGRPCARSGQCRLSGDRELPAREGLPRLGRRHRSRPHADRSRVGVGGEAAHRHAVQGPRRRSRRSGRTVCARCWLRSRSTRRWCCWGARRSSATASASAG